MASKAVAVTAGGGACGLDEGCSCGRVCKVGCYDDGSYGEGVKRLLLWSGKGPWQRGWFEKDGGGEGGCGDGGRWGVRFRRWQLQ